MGAVPSREFTESPSSFYFAKCGPFVTAVLPLTESFFPSPDCLAFQQVYQCRMSQSAKYNFMYYSPSYQEAVKNHMSDNKPVPHFAPSTEQEEERPSGGSPAVSEVNASNFEQLYGNPEKYVLCPEDQQTSPDIPWREDPPPIYVKFNRPHVFSYEEQEKMLTDIPLTRSAEELWDFLVKNRRSGVFDTNKEICEIYQKELDWIAARDIVRKYRRQQKGIVEENEELVSKEEMEKAAQHPPPGHFLIPTSLVIIVPLTHQQELDMRAEYYEKNSLPTPDRVVYRFTKDPKYKDGKMHLVEEDGVLYLFAYNKTYLKKHPEKMSANAGGDDEEENGLQNSRLSSFQMSVEDPNGYDDEKNYDDGEVFKGDSADAEAEFSLPVCPVKVAGCHGYTESITRGTAWLRGTDDDPEEDAYIENELTVKPPVCYAFSFVGAYIGEKIISRALLLSGQVYHNTCIQAGLPHSITRPYYSMKALYNVPMLQLAREMRYRCRLAMAEVLEGFDLMKKLIQNTDKDLVAHVQQSTRAFQEAVETVEKQVSRNKQLDDISAADGPERDRLLKVLEENLTKTREEEDLDLETIRGVRVMNRNGAEKSRKIFYWLSKATTPASPSLFMRPFESDDYDYGGSVKMNLLYTKEVMSRGENKQGNEEYQILPPPMNLEAMKDYARQLTEYVCCSLRSDAKDEEGKPVPADSSNTDNSTTFHLPVYCVTYTGPDAIGPTVARRNRLIEEGKIEAAENVKENEHITEDVPLATEHQYMYPRGTFIDGDLVYYDLRKGKWVHLWSFLEERNLRRMKQGRVVAKDITALMPCLNDILLGWIKRTLQVAADNNRQAENWLRDPVTNNIIQEGRYHIWSFHHDGHDLFYGLIPKFAKHERKKHKNKSNKSPTSSCPNSAMQSTTNRRKASASFSSESGGEESVTRRKGQEAITTIVPPVSRIAGGATHHSPTASNESSASRKKAETAASKSSGDMGMTGSQGKKTPTGSASSFHNSPNTSQTRADRSGKIPPSSAAPRAAHYNQGSQARQKAAESTDVYQYGWPAPQRVVYRDAAAQSPPMQTNVPPPLQGGYQPNPRVQNNNYKNKNSNPTFNPNASPNSGATGHLYNAPNMSNAPFSNVQNSFPNPQPNANPSHNRTPNHQFMNPNPAANAYHNFNPNQHANFNTNPNNVHNPNNMNPNQIGGNNNGNYGQRPHHMNVQQAAAPVPQYAGVQRQPAPAPRGGGPETGVQMVYPGNNNNFNNNNNSNNYYNNTTGPTGVVLHGGKKGQRVYCPNNQNNTTVNNMTPVPHTIPAAPQVGQYPPQPSYFPSSNQQSPAPTFNHQHTFHAGYIQPPPSSQPQAPPPPFVPSAVTATAPPPHRGQGQAPSQAYPRGQPQQTAQQRFPHPTGNFNPNASDAHRQGHESQKRNSNYSHNPYDVQP